MSRGPEAEFTTKVKPWIRENLPTCAWEIKHTRGSEYFNLSEMHEHQKDCLEAATSRYGFCYKIPDDGVAYKPFDGFNLKMTPAFVIIAYPEEFVVIEIEKVLKEKTPSLPYERAISIACIRASYKVLN